jgi:hypothetical protein
MSNGSAPRRRATRRASAKPDWSSGRELAKYCALLRIPSAMEEVRREIEAQGLQDLIDPEHKMDADAWLNGRAWHNGRRMVSSASVRRPPRLVPAVDLALN